MCQMYQPRTRIVERTRFTRRARIVTMAFERISIGTRSALLRTRSCDTSRTMEHSLRHLISKQYNRIHILLGTPNFTLFIALEISIMNPGHHVIIQIQRLRQLATIVVLPGGIIRHYALAVPSLRCGRAVCGRVVRGGGSRGHGRDRGWQGAENVPVAVQGGGAGQVSGAGSEIVREPQRVERQFLLRRTAILGLAIANITAGTTFTLGIRIIHPANIHTDAPPPHLVIGMYQIQYTTASISHCQCHLTRRTENTHVTQLTIWTG
mmetsp:Transcript_2397/g.5068  ORF Transcript_2397/g.5068 Transcript_2397/m.5068 type:complete len:265 (-) Transcript_2397:793-1587(-)